MPNRTNLFLPQSLRPGGSLCLNHSSFLPPPSWISVAHRLNVSVISLDEVTPLSTGLPLPLSDSLHRPPTLFTDIFYRALSLVNYELLSKDNHFYEACILLFTKQRIYKCIWIFDTSSVYCLYCVGKAFKHQQTPFTCWKMQNHCVAVTNFFGFHLIKFVRRMKEGLYHPREKQVPHTWLQSLWVTTSLRHRRA